MSSLNLNPNQPLPVVLASKLCPPPVWPLPTVDWMSLPVVAPGFPSGPFTPSYAGPVGSGAWPGVSSCPGSGEGGTVLVPGTIISVNVTAGGTGYTTATATASGGTGAVLTPVISGGVITGVTVVNGGSGYTNGGAVTITGDGTGAAATLVTA